MTHGEEVIVHIPEVDPVRHRWFVVSVVVTSGLVVGSWMYFFFGQLASLATSVPKSFASDFVVNAVDSGKDFGDAAATDFQKTVSPLTAEVIQQMDSRIEVESAKAALAQKMMEAMTAQAAAAEEEPAE